MFIRQNSPAESVTENHDEDSSGGALSRRGLFGATLAVTSGFGLASMAGSAVAQTQEGTVYLRDAHIGASDSRGNITSREGWLYFETDTGDIYYDNDGSGWQDLGGGLGSRELTVIDSQQSTYSTEGSSVVYVDTSSTGEPVRLTIDAANEVNGAPLEVYDTGENAGTHPITIENNSGELVTELGVDRAYTELIYQEPRWLVKTSKGEGIWNTYAHSLSGVSDSVVDDFERGNLNPYIGQTGSYTTTQAAVPEGDRALEPTTNDTNHVIISEQGGGLGTYPQEGDIVSCLIRDASTTTTSPALIVNAAENSTGQFDGYSIWIRSDSEYRIMRHDDSPFNGSSTNRTTLSSGSIGGTINNDTWYWLEIQTPTTGGQNIEISLFEFDTSTFEIGSQVGSTQSVSDTNHATNRGVGAQVSVGADVGAFIDLIGIMNSSSV
jgi:hypothetical protein